MKFFQKDSGFTLIEVLIYTVIFSVSAVFLVSILTTITRVQSRQTSVNEVNSQIGFVDKTIQRLVREASLVDMTAGTATGTLKLRMATSTLDPTTIYVDASGTAIYLQEGSASPQALTDSNILVKNFWVTKFENPGGPTIVQVDLALEYNATTPQMKATRTLQTAVTKISAATFDSSVLPNTNNSYDIGNAANNWKDAYFAGSVGIGTSPVSGAKLKSTGDIGFSNSSVGVVFMSPGGTCYRVTITNGGNIATSTLACP